MEGAAEYNALLDTIERSASGLSLAEIGQQHPTIPRRTAQRWVSKWVTQGFVAAYGEGRARRYHSYRYAANAVAEPGPDDEYSIPLSADARDIVVYLEQPYSKRKAVDFSAKFLDGYIPNVTRYLSAALCRQLRKMGEPTEADAPTGSLVYEILSQLLIDLSWASSRLEGNTYTLLETARLIEKNITAENKSIIDAQMILNHKAAIELLVNNADVIGFDRYTIMNLHSSLAYGLLENEEDEGRVRRRAVIIGQSRYRPLAIPAKIEEMMDRFLSCVNAIDDPFEQSFFAMVHLPYLQPFMDVNKRTSRLAANIPLIKHNLCPITFMGVSRKVYTQALLGVYELNRVELLRDVYVAAYARSTSEYFTLKRDLVAPDPRRLAHRELIRQTIINIVRDEHQNPLDLIDEALREGVTEADRPDTRSIIIRELSVLHEGKLARYGLKRSELSAWQLRQRVVV